MTNFIPTFRGKTLDGRWVEGDLVHEAVDGNSRTILVGIQSPRCYPVEVLYKTIGISTGKTDTNGKMIFGGDIVKSYLGSIGVVKYGEYEQDGSGGEYSGVDCLGFYVEFTENRKDDYREYSVLGYCGENEIIGNTTDNGDLIQ